MNFSLSEEQQMMQKTVRDFAEKEIKPVIGKWEEKGQFPREIVAKMGELGLMGIPIPEEWGGVGADFLSYVIAIEEISRASAALGVILAVHTSVGTFPILNFGSEEQKKKYVPALAQGKMLGAFALSEPDAGSDAANIRTSAVRKGDHYVLNGSKIFITNGGEADVYTVLAVTDKSKGTRGISAFLVEKSTPGLKIGPPEKKMGLHCSSTCQLFFEDAVVPQENLLGKEGEGFKIAMSLLDTGRIGIGAQALGIAQAALEAAVAYARERKQFGKAIAEFQAIQFMLADMDTLVQAARLLVYRAASLKMQGSPHSKEASMAKMFASDVAMKVTTDAVQIFGGYGYMREYPVERFMRDAKVTQIYEGTNQIQRIVIARNLLK
ncbi:acyl-CoA dehydrogenase [Calderihabitans maritimus]|uniref:Acyl-CoA dehydrogenase n=1 Tax=Calderihabitans maritimus TaxID=1246530 RepID=A0A1Z5HQX5_9FIRM|nr:acyl-CoA dehydrogenase [Calderihabitans maritimus]GAW91721.1 acyl-CoA dehydrogenase [Calderihabitans maritimus]